MLPNLVVTIEDATERRKRSDGQRLAVREQAAEAGRARRGLRQHGVDVRSGSSAAATHDWLELYTGLRERNEECGQRQGFLWKSSVVMW